MLRLAAIRLLQAIWRRIPRRSAVPGAVASFVTPRPEPAICIRLAGGAVTTFGCHLFFGEAVGGLHFAAPCDAIRGTYFVSAFRARVVPVAGRQKQPSEYAAYRDNRDDLRWLGAPPPCGYAN